MRIPVRYIFFSFYRKQTFVPSDNRNLAKNKRQICINLLGARIICVRAILPWNPSKAKGEKSPYLFKRFRLAVERDYLWLKINQQFMILILCQGNADESSSICLLCFPGMLRSPQLGARSKQHFINSSNI